MFNLYKFLSNIFIPIIWLNIYFRLIKKKEDKKRYQERIGNTEIEIKNSKKIIWIHAASVGEFKSSHTIIEKYYRDFQILVTTTTKSSAEYIQNYYSNKVTHQYMPFDVPLWCNRFVNFWKPSLVLWIESDIWPNMLEVIKKKKIQCFYLNARISPKSFNRWKNFKKLYSKSLSTFKKIYVQSPDDLKRLKILSNSNIEFIGNLKLSNNNDEIYHNNKKKFSLMIVSSHKNEEEQIIHNLKKIIKSNKLKLCIAPRHLERIGEISKLLLNNQLSFSLDSNKNADDDVIIIDSFGKLDLYFNRSAIVVLGGSFVNKGGHNPIEPARYGCAIISGNNIFNWQNIYDEMTKQGACKVLDNIEDIGHIINEFILNKKLLEDSQKKALDFSKKKFFDNETLFNEINLVLN